METKFETNFRKTENEFGELLFDFSDYSIQTIDNPPDVSLTYINGSLDRYGRVVNHSWVKNNNPLVHIIHSYDYSGNRTKRYDAIHVANSELYIYDNLGQIKSLNRGILNNNHTSVTTINHSESWNFDKTGNWVQYTNNGNTENRTHNAANELQGIATHDANGNMILMPGLKGKYDAWNRLVEVRDISDNLIAIYEYNGLNQRIRKTVGNIVIKSFFNENWQELESVTNSQVTSYVWGLRYIDDLVLREKGEGRLYSLADPNWNVIAICNSTGSVVERMRYDAFGKITWLDTNFSTKNSSNYDWHRTFTGQVIDFETGLMLYRNRFYNSVLGRFVSRDPIGYKANDINLLRYVKNSIIILLDYSGLEIKSIPIIGTIWKEGDKRTSKGSMKYSSHHCYTTCRLDLLVTFPGLGAGIGDIREVYLGLKDDWTKDIYNNHKGSLCALAILSNGIGYGVSRFACLASKLCDACCGTSP
jgi:RHS repeat-associated protein